MLRPAYTTGKYLLADDLEVEQQYRKQRLRRHNRFLHDWGVVCGLQVVPAQDPKRPWAVLVCPGYAIDCCGNEIVVSERVVLDIREHLWSRPATRRRIGYVVIRYAEEPVRPVPAPSLQCGCDDTSYVASRIRDSFQLDVVWRLSESQKMKVIDLCESPIVPSPDCGDHAYVVLDALRLPLSEGDLITDAHIDNQRLLIR